MTSDVNINTALKQQQQTGLTDKKLAEDFDQFLTLLTTQLQNQDPLSPMDSTEFTNQLVQFSQVEQQINQNKKLDSLVQLQLSNAFSSSLSYVGMDARYVSSEFSYDGQAPVDISYAISGDALSAKINIYDASGSLVYSGNGDSTTGSHDFTWDGKSTGGAQLEAGTYSVKIAALDADDAPVTTSTVVSGRVRGIETQNGSIYLLIGDRAVSIANVINASLPPETPENGADQADDT